MERWIKHQPSRLRCYQCGSPDVRVVCHHCGRPMCRRHGPVRPILSWWTENREFVHLNLEHEPFATHEGVHCEECLHSSPNYRRLFLYPGILVLLIGLWLLVSHGIDLQRCLSHRPPHVEILPQSLYAEFARDPLAYRQAVTGAYCYTPGLVSGIAGMLQSLLVVVLGLGMVVLGVYMNRERVAADLAGWRPPLPVGPITDAIRVVEKWQAEQSIGRDGSIQVRQVGDIEGVLDPGFRFTVLDQQRYREYLQKYRLPAGTSLDFSGGFLALKGTPAIQWEDQSALVPGYETLLRLQGHTQEVPYLEGNQEYGNLWPWEKRYKVRLQYREDTSRLWEGAPVRVLPLLENQGDHYRLRLELQLQREAFPTLKENERIDIQVLNLKVERSLGRPRVQRGMVHQDEQRDAFWVTWRDLQFSAGEGHFWLPAVEFEQALLPSAKLEGKLKLRVPAMVSGLEEVRYFSALGYQVKGGRFHGVTEIVLNFQLTLAATPMVHFLLQTWHTLVPGLPTRGRFDALLQTLNRVASQGNDDAAWVVSQVLTEPPRFSGENATRYRWYWDVTGRRYYETLPVDFHLVLYGAEHGRLDITVQGQSFDEKSGEAVRHTLAELKEIARMALLAQEEEE